MASKKKSWKEKLNNSNGLPKVEMLPLNCKWGSGAMLIPAPIEVDEIMKTVPKGKLITTNEIRKKLAKKHGTNIACPLTTGIFTWIAANAAEEDAINGIKNHTPYWRTLKTGGELNPKYPGGIEQHKSLLEAEGFTIIQKGKKWLVKNFEAYLISS